MPAPVLSDRPAANETSVDQLQANGPERLIVRVRSITYQGEDLNEYELVDPEGAELPPFTAGSHIDLYFRDGRVRQYSLCNAESERHRYKIVVQREHQGRGGSKAIFERVHVGRRLVISKPRSSFSIFRAARRHILVAGGIGITPLISMALTLDAENQDFVLHYCSRSPARTALASELQSLVSRQKAHIHHDGGDPTKGLNLKALLDYHEPGSHLYFCGPTGFMRAVAAAAAHWPSGALHSESFNPLQHPTTSTAGIVSQSELDASISVGFQVKIASTGKLIEVPNDKSILQVLREHGIGVPSSCESGLCGTCRVAYLEGVPDHRDYILEDEQREKELLVCCSRSKTRLLVLDL
jgi:vanillate O-demethylase ferredoxin subunit